MGSWSWIASACSAGLILTLAGCGGKALPVLGSVPPFQLTSQDNALFDSKVLDGNVWVADFVFTNCPGPCPRMTSQMRRLQQAFPGNPEVKFVSITIDPVRDTPPVLSEYAKKFHADTAQWSFLTGPVAALNQLSKRVFLLGDIDGVNFEHSTRFMLVDRRSRIRGAYVSAEPEIIPTLTEDIKRLLKEKR